MQVIRRRQDIWSGTVCDGPSGLDPCEKVHEAAEPHLHGTLQRCHLRVFIGRGGDHWVAVLASPTEFAAAGQRKFADGPAVERILVRIGTRADAAAAPPKEGTWPFCVGKLLCCRRMPILRCAQALRQLAQKPLCALVHQQREYGYDFVQLRGALERSARRRRVLRPYLQVEV